MVSLKTLIIFVVVGALVGALAAKLMKKNISLVGCIIVGIVGSLVGQFLLKLVHINITGTSGLSNLIVTICISMFGACILLKLVDLVKK